MNLLFYLIIHTSNVLGSFNDPFEFEGDYGSEVNPVRQKVFELVVSKEALSKNLNDSQIRQLMEKEDVNEIEIKNYRKILLSQAIEEDRSHGPLLSELVTPDLINDLVEKQQELQNAGFNKNDLQDIVIFINQYADKKVFHFLRNNPSELLSFDKALRDKASREGKKFNLPILSSTQTLNGRNSEELKKDLLQILFNAENLSITKPKELLGKSISQLDKDFLEQFFGENAKSEDLQVFCTPAGQIFFYWLYQALNLHLISEDQNMIDQINKVKEIFAHTIGDPQVRAEIFREKLIAADSGIVFTQESDVFVPQTLLKDGLFLPVDKQNPQDGTFIFLRSDLWESDYDIISLEEYEGFTKGRVNLILAKSKLTGEKFLLASAHGNSTRSEDGRLQISFVVKKFEELSQKPENTGLQLVIGTDANTKTEEDVRLLREHLDILGLIGTNVGPTTIKKRMVTVQHGKAGKFAVDQEDYLIVLKPEKGGRFLLTQPTIGFSEEKPDVTIALPNVNNLSDHYPVGATLVQ
jgi:hypothetical protein